MRTIRKVAPVALAAALALGVTSCAESEREGDGGEGDGEGGTFTFGAAGAPEMFDPLYATDGETFRVTRQMFEGLLGIEPGSAEVVPRAGHGVDLQRGGHRVGRSRCATT